MLYDVKAHLPQVMDKMMVEDYRAGDVTKLENDKTIIVKLLGDNESFCRRIKVIDDEHKKRKSNVLIKLEDIDRKRIGLVEELDKVERDYWETVIGEITRYIQNVDTVEAVVVDQDE